MTAGAQPKQEKDPPPPPKRRPLIAVRDDVAYFLPMATFMVFILLASRWPKQYPAFYAVRTVMVAALLWALWPYYTRIRWRYGWLGLLFGVIGILQWVPMQLWLQHHFEFFRPDVSNVFNPKAHFATPAGLWSFVAVRLIGAVLVVPVMEELFWRDFLWRQIIAPNDFKLAGVGEWDWKAFLAVSALFAVVHGNWWLTSIVWAMLAGALLVMTRSLGACIIMHATTNLLLAVYVLKWEDWSFW